MPSVLNWAHCTAQVWLRRQLLEFEFRVYAIVVPRVFALLLRCPELCTLNSSDTQAYTGTVHVGTAWLSLKIRCRKATGQTTIG